MVASDERSGPDTPSPKRDADVTQLLRASESGSKSDRDELLNLVYKELHTIAQSQMRAERDDHTLSATALVNETYLKLFRQTGSDPTPPIPKASPWTGRAGFYAAAASAMRRILIDHARANAANKRGGDRSTRGTRVSLDVIEAANDLTPDQFLSLDNAISRLSDIDERAATVVKLRFYTGLQQSQIGELLGVTERTIKRDWQFARAWLHEQLATEGQDEKE